MDEIDITRYGGILRAVYGPTVYEHTNGKAPLALVLTNARDLLIARLAGRILLSKQEIVNAMDECVWRAIRAWKGEIGHREPSWRVGESSDSTWWEA